MIKLKRAYDKPRPDDGLRVLVERLWPRGITKKQAHLDLWLKDVAPSTELRQWFNHDPSRWSEFRRRYKAELQQKKDVLDALSKKTRQETVSFVYGARDERHNAALVLKSFIESQTRH